jgi:hypothetical protein
VPLRSVTEIDYLLICIKHPYLTANTPVDLECMLEDSFMFLIDVFYQTQLGRRGIHCA